MAAWYPCIFISGIGLLFVVITYAAWFASKRSGKHVSGMPCFGGILIALGFLLSPCKLLAILGLIDYGFWMLFFSLLQDLGFVKKKSAQDDPPKQ